MKFKAFGLFIQIKRLIFVLEKIIVQPITKRKSYERVKA